VNTPVLLIPGGASKKSKKQAVSLYVGGNFSSMGGG